MIIIIFDGAHDVFLWSFYIEILLLDCVAQRDEGVKIFQEKMMKKFELTTTTKYGTSYASIQAAEYINQVECYDSTHGLL